MQIFVKMMTGKQTWTLDVNPANSIDSIKRQLQGATRIPHDEQRLIFAGEMLKNDRTLDDYKIEHGKTIRMVLWLLGSGKRAKPSSGGMEELGMMFAPTAALTDHQTGMAALNLKTIAIEAWLDSKTASELSRMMEKLQGQGKNSQLSTLLRPLLQYVTEFKDLEDRVILKTTQPD